MELMFILFCQYLHKYYCQHFKSGKNRNLYSQNQFVVCSRQKTTTDTDYRDNTIGSTVIMKRCVFIADRDTEQNRWHSNFYIRHVTCKQVRMYYISGTGAGETLRRFVFTHQVAAVFCVMAAILKL